MKMKGGRNRINQKEGMGENEDKNSPYTS